MKILKAETPANATIAVRCSSIFALSPEPEHICWKEDGGHGGVVEERWEEGEEVGRCCGGGILRARWSRGLKTMDAGRKKQLRWDSVLN